jgi:vacuolar-type H+-ATPase subunit F/Vma7
MRVVMVGRAPEVRGFALAGVETRRCANAAEAQGAVTLLADERPAPGLVIVSPWAATAAARAIAHARRRSRPPVIVVLPEAFR